MGPKSNMSGVLLREETQTYIDDSHTKKAEGRVRFA
jgi:hypothetical protein